MTSPPPAIPRFIADPVAPLASLALGTAALASAVLGGARPLPAELDGSLFLASLLGGTAALFFAGVALAPRTALPRWARWCVSLGAVAGGAGLAAVVAAIVRMALVADFGA